jgi:hypothetical protein
MTAPGEYLYQARLCFDMANMARDPAVRARWIERANDYQLLAAQAEAPASEDGAARHPTQRQQEQAPDQGPPTLDQPSRRGGHGE